MSELGYPPSGATQLWLDNQSAIRVGKNPEHHSRMRHLLPKCHWLREQVEDKIFSLDYVPTASMRSDGLTKPLDTTDGSYARVCAFRPFFSTIFVKWECCSHSYILLFLIIY